MTARLADKDLHGHDERCGDYDGERERERNLAHPTRLVLIQIGWTFRPQGNEDYFVVSCFRFDRT